ncbi:MAG: hypothetical protein AAGB13_16790 [Cyanobacteria bacterium P01_F01_bin.33]
MRLSERSTVIALLALPFVGLLYCGLVVAAMLSFPILRAHPLLSGSATAMIPLTIAASIWLIASAKAYRKSRH